MCSNHHTDGGHLLWIWVYMGMHLSACRGGRQGRDCVTSAFMLHVGLGEAVPPWAVYYGDRTLVQSSFFLFFDIWTPWNLGDVENHNGLYHEGIWNFISSSGHHTLSCKKIPLTYQFSNETLSRSPFCRTDKHISPLGKKTRALWVCLPIPNLPTSPWHLLVPYPSPTPTGVSTRCSLQSTDLEKSHYRNGETET